MHDSDHTQMFRERERETALLGKSAAIRGSQPRIKFLVHVFACMCALAATVTLPWPLLLASKRIMGQLTVCQASVWRSVLKKKIEKLDKKQTDWETCVWTKSILSVKLFQTPSEIICKRRKGIWNIYQKFGNMLKHIVYLNAFIKILPQLRRSKKCNNSHVLHTCSKDDVLSPKTHKWQSDICETSASWLTLLWTLQKKREALKSILRYRIMKYWLYKNETIPCKLLKLWRITRWSRAESQPWCDNTRTLPIKSVKLSTLQVCEAMWQN